MIHFRYLALASTIALASAVPDSCFAGERTAPKQSPDNFSNVDLHLPFHFVAGIVTTIVMPETKPLHQWAICQIPGAIHEFAPSPGNYRSNRDLLVNAIGCGLGVFAGHGFGIAPRHGGVQITMHKEF